MTMHNIVVTDANGNDFCAMTEAHYEAEEGVYAFVFFDDRDNGFNLNDGVFAVANLKKLGSPNEGKYGA